MLSFLRIFNAGMVMENSGTQLLIVRMSTIYTCLSRTKAASIEETQNSESELAISFVIGIGK